MSSTKVDLEAVPLDSVELKQLHQVIARKQQFASFLPKLFFAIYLVCAVTVTFLCLTSSSFRPFLTQVVPAEGAHEAQEMRFAAESLNVEKNSGDEFNAQYSCSGSDHMCSNSYGSWCCHNGDSCDSDYGYCDSINVGLVVGIVIAVWLGPLALYLIIIALIRLSSADRFRSLADSGQYQSWVIVSGCFQMSVERSSGDADFNQAVFSLVNAYGGCGDECLMHTVGICCFGACYPCCMCCVSAGRNQTKVGTIQSALSFRGYNTSVQFLSSVIPACCNSIFIGKVGTVATNVMIVSAGGGMAVAGAPLVAQPYQMPYPQYGGYQQQAYQQQAYQQQPYTQAVLPGYGAQPAAVPPGYQPPQPSAQPAAAQSYGAVPPDVNKP